MSKETEDKIDKAANKYSEQDWEPFQSRDAINEVRELVSNAYEKGREDGLNEETTATLTLYGLIEIKPK